MRVSSLSADVRFGLLASCVVVVGQAITTEQQVILQATMQFGRRAALIVVLGASGLIGGILGAVLGGVRGVFISQLIAAVVTVMFSFALTGFPRPEPIRRSFLLRLLKAGIPFVLLAFVGYNLVYVDQVMVLSLLGSTSLGVYTLALYAGSVMVLLPAALASAVGPRLLRRYGEEPTTQAIDVLTWRPVAGLSVAMPVIIAAMWSLGPWGIAWLLPAYSSVIGPLRVYIVGVFFLAINLGAGNTLFALNKHKYMIPIIAGCIGLNVCLDILYVSGLHWGLMGIALGSACTYFAYWMVHTTVVRHYFQQRLLRALALNLASGWPGLVLAAADLLAWLTGNLRGPSWTFGSLLLIAVAASSLLRWREVAGWTHGEPGDEPS